MEDLSRGGTGLFPVPIQPSRDRPRLDRRRLAGSASWNHRQRVEATKDAGVMPVQWLPAKLDLRESLDEYFQHDSHLHSSQARTETKMSAERKGERRQRFRLPCPTPRVEETRIGVGS